MNKIEEIINNYEMVFVNNEALNINDAGSEVELYEANKLWKIKELETLIQEEKEKAYQKGKEDGVRGYLDTMLNRTQHFSERNGLMKGEKLDNFLRGHAEQYINKLNERE